MSLDRFRNLLFKFSNAARRIINPRARSSQYVYKEAYADLLNEDTVWLYLGCGHRLLQDWMPKADAEQQELIDRARLVAGVDVDLGTVKKHEAISLRALGDIERLPFKDESFSLISANMVLEHVSDPASLLKEVRRVLRPGGLFVFHTPNVLSPINLLAVPVPQKLKNKIVWYLEGRDEDDVYPTYYRCNTAHRVRELALGGDFQIRDLLELDSNPEFIMFGPLVVLELCYMRILRANWLKALRRYLIVVLEKPVAS